MPDEARFFECTWVGQFRAASPDHAHRFAQVIADFMTKYGVHDVGYDAKIMPREALTDDSARITFTGQGGGVVHPWDQGLAIFPEEHPLRKYEDLARRGGSESEKEVFIETARRLELEAGDGEDVD